MGNTCYGCGKKTDVVTERDPNGTADKNASLNGVQAKSLLTGKIGVEDNDNTTSKNRRVSEETIWFDAMDRFPSSNGMLYPPTDSMRQLPIEFDMKRNESLRLLLNSSFQASVASRIGETPPSPSSKETRASVALVSQHLSAGNEGAQGRGYPGELTEDELETCLIFREELKKRDPAFKEMVMAMHPYEEEAFALCRFLRARDFDAEDVFSMMQEKNQTENWNAVKSQDPNFFKEFHKTIPDFNGCPLPVFLTQFPCMEAGIGKNGAIIVYFKAGKVSCPGVECIVGDLVNALPFAWNRLYNGCRDAMKREIARSDAANTTVLAEKIIVIDLEGDSSLFTSGLSFLRASPTAGACFPENVNRTYILNAPFSFSIAWAGIRQMLDPRTVKKVGFFTTIAKAETDFLEHIESDELLSCYGGTGQSFDDMVADRQREYTHKEGVIRYVVELLAMSGRPVGFDFDLMGNEKVDSIVVYSRSDNMCEISVVDGKSDDVIDFRNVSREHATSKVSFSPDTQENALAHNNYAVEIASSEDFDNDAKGPFSVKTKGGTKGDYFLVAVSVTKK
mmetsp:Transcript_15342/g.38662  ORF Transcript_15342/g.38662 Transcript_15342/m.38662 type:complete len:564 (+) Transcript_15342:133-1824(+)|eukprot:CAMPEP_0116087804 /NCGR_PEP_ID=MMETSP0327-20121206/5548_1 /TAXON_ID=44447 /ORGANISM="Pseudo-nitzschia delicatissima, Strain B596" /LENGTH=563 /DNA_ID=CAMNT_0003578875 /DNA_START=91 /DNA_END=1782 /DNA_ORIENTATION=-